MIRRVGFGIVTVLGLAGFAEPSFSQGRFGFGFIIGEPTGFSWKHRIDAANAIDGAIGFSPYDRFRLHVDYLWIAYPAQDQNFTLHYGVGAAMGFGWTEYISAKRRGEVFLVRKNDLGLGVRGVFGVNYLIPRSPVELFLELGPLLIFTPDGGSGIDAGIGMRFYP